MIEVGIARKVAKEWGKGIGRLRTAVLMEEVSTMHRSAARAAALEEMKRICDEGDTLFRILMIGKIEDA